MKFQDIKVVHIDPEKSQIELATATVTPIETLTDTTLPEVLRVTTSKPAVSFPEGGWQGWMTVIGAALSQFATFGYVNAFGVYEGYFYVRDYLTSYSPSSIGWIGSIQIFLVFSSGIFTGRLFDRGYFYHMIIAGFILYAVSFFMMSLAHKNQYYQIFLSQGLGGGLACGLSYVPSMTVPSHYFQRRRALAVGIVTSGSALGAIIHPIMLNQLINGSIGFANGVRISAAMNTFLIFVSLLMMRTRLPPRKGAGQKLPVVQFLSEPAYLLVWIAGIFFIAGFFFPVFYIQTDAIQHGVDRKIAFYLISILNASSFFGRIIPTSLVPRLGVFNLIIFATIGMAVTIWCHLAVHDLGGFVAIAIFFGFFSGAGIALTPPLLTTLAKDMSEFGARLGIQFFGAGIMGLVATPILGALLTHEFLWWRAILFAGITMVASVLFFIMGRIVVSRKKETIWF